MIETSARQEFITGFEDAFYMSTMSDIGYTEIAFGPDMQADLKHTDNLHVDAQTKDVQSAVFGHQASALGGYFLGKYCAMAVLPVTCAMRKKHGSDIIQRAWQRKNNFLQHVRHRPDPNAADNSAKTSSPMLLINIGEVAARAAGLATLAGLLYLGGNGAKAAVKTVGHLFAENKAPVKEFIVLPAIASATTGYYNVQPN